MSIDMFENSLQTPLLRAPNTPSMTPASRSVKRRFNRTKEVNKPRDSPTWAELMAQYGISDGLEEEPKQSLGKGEREVYTWSSKCLIILGLLCVMVASAFLGALFHAQFQHYFFNTNSCSSQFQLTQDVPIDRSANQATHSHHLETSMLHISEELKHLKDRLSNLQENVGREVIPIPQKGILEELLTADLACAGNLGSVLATPGTTTVTVPATFTMLWFLSFHVRLNYRTPHTTIEGLIQEVGDCWPFEGNQGRLVLKLHQRSLVSGVSISHIPPSVSVSGDVSSAPQLFQVWVHQEEEDLENGQILGEFEYKISSAWRQKFAFEPAKTKDLVQFIEFRFLKNHGNPNYTCVYRVHVHGETW